MIKQHVAQKVDEWQKKQGIIPGNLKRFADQVLRPKVDPFSRVP